MARKNAKPERNYALAKALLSARYSATSSSGAQKLSAQQQERMAEFRERLEDGRYQMVSEDCPCAVPAKHYLLSEADRYGLPLDSVLCWNCGSVRIDPFLDAASLDHFYREMYQELYGRAINLPRYFTGQGAYGRKVADWAESLGQQGCSRVLEVGCGSGGAISIFHQQGHFVAGCDYDSDLLDYGTAQGIPNLICGSVSEALETFGPQAFDVIYLHHVFEHVGAPLAMLECLRELLCPGGSVLVIVPELEFVHDHPIPNGDSLKFFHIAHKYNFSYEGLALLARRAGFHAQRVTPPVQKTKWSQMPELWMRLEPASAHADPPDVDPDAGGRILRRLQQTEQAYLRKRRHAYLTYQWQRFRRHLGEYTRAVWPTRKAA